MFLKRRYDLGYESLCGEVADSIGWRRFTGIGIDGRVPHPTSLMKITTRCGSEVIEALNEALLAKAAAAKVLRVGKVRADTTVVSATVDYPTDAGLLAKAVVKMGRLVKRVRAAGGAPRTRCPDHSRAAGRRARQIASKLRLRGAHAKEEAQRVVVQATAALAALAESSARDAHARSCHQWSADSASTNDRSLFVGDPIAVVIQEGEARHVVGPGQGDRFQEVAGHQRVSLRAQEVGPGAGRSVGRRVDPRLP
jgi:IS5 family transposase